MDADVFMALKYMALQILIAVTYIVFFLSEHAFHSGTYKVHGRLKGEFNHEKKIFCPFLLTFMSFQAHLTSFLQKFLQE